MTIESPNLSSDRKYSFYLNSAISGYANPVQILKTLVISKGTSPETSIDQTAYVVSAVVGSAIGAAITYLLFKSLTNASSIVVVWIAFEQLQMFLLLLLIKVFIPKEIRTVIKGLDFASNIYEYVPFKNLGLYPSFLKSFEFELTNPALTDLGINYNSTFANMYSAIVSFIFMIILYLLMLLLKMLWSKRRENQSCWRIFANKVIEKILKIMIFDFFIRNSLEMSQFVLVSTSNEIYYLNISSLPRIISMIISLLMIVAFVWIVVIIIRLTFSSYKLDENKHNKLEEFIRNLQSNKKARFLSVLILLRKLLFVFILVILESIDSKIIVIVMSFFQVIYTAYCAIIRPYDRAKLNFFEILNEIFFTAFLISLIFLNTESKWNSALTSVYMWTLSLNAVVIFMIVAKSNSK